MWPSKTASTTKSLLHTWSMYHGKMKEKYYIIESSTVVWNTLCLGLSSFYIHLNSVTVRIWSMYSKWYCLHFCKLHTVGCYVLKLQMLNACRTFWCSGCFINVKFCMCCIKNLNLICSIPITILTTMMDHNLVVRT